jgi:hypothetical protein
MPTNKATMTEPLDPSAGLACLEASFAATCNCFGQLLQVLADLLVLLPVALLVLLAAVVGSLRG